MADKSESFRKGVNLNLGKTFESGLNLGFDAFIGETTETGKYNVAPKKTILSWFNRYELQYRIFVLIAVIYLLITHYTGC